MKTIHLFLSVQSTIVIYSLIYLTLPSIFKLNIILHTITLSLGLWLGYMLFKVGEGEI